MIATDEQHRMSVAALEEALEADRRNGIRPWLVVASGGHGRHGRDRSAAGDRRALPQIWRLVPRRWRLWRAVRALRRRPRAAPRHRAGGQRRARPAQDPVPSVRHRRRTGPRRPASCPTPSAHRREYIRPLGESEVGPSPADLSPELTRHFRALRLWLPLQMAGVAAFRAAQSEKLALARYFHARLVGDRRLRPGPGARPFGRRLPLRCPRAAMRTISPSG